MFEAEIKQAATKYSLDVNLITAIVATESSFNPWAMRYEIASDRYVRDAMAYASNLQISTNTETICQKSSFGLMQVMGFLARELGYQDHIVKLCIPEVGLDLGCKQLKRLFQRYGYEPDVISSYNQGSPVKTLGGMYVNQIYVDKVNAKLTSLRSLA